MARAVTAAGPSPAPGVRRLLLDEAPGERRGVVLLDSRPERLLIERDEGDAVAALGARFVGRVAALAGERAFVALPDGSDGVLRLPPARPPVGAAIEVEVVAEAHGDKGPRLAWRGAAEGPLRRVAPPPPLAARLEAFAPGTQVEGGGAARDAADLAEEAALAVTHRFHGGLTLHVEPTRALAAVDVDLAAGDGAGERRLREANLSAIRHAVRLLRLKALGGVAVLDLAGLPAPGDRGLLRAEARRALVADGPQAEAFAPDRLGLVTLVRPRRERPLDCTLLGPDGVATPRTVAQRLVRDLQRAAAAEPGSRWTACASAEAVAVLSRLLPQLGSRFDVRELASGEWGAHIRRA